MKIKRFPKLSHLFRHDPPRREIYLRIESVNREIQWTLSLYESALMHRCFDTCQRCVRHMALLEHEIIALARQSTEVVENWAPKRGRR